MRGARGRVVHRKGAFEQVAQPVADQGRVLGLGVIQGHTHDLGGMARLLEQFEHLGIAIRIDTGFIWHNTVPSNAGGGYQEVTAVNLGPNRTSVLVTLAFLLFGRAAQL